MSHCTTLFLYEYQAQRNRDNCTVTASFSMSLHAKHKKFYLLELVSHKDNLIFPIFFFFWWGGGGGGDHFKKQVSAKYSQTSMAQTPLKYVRDRGSLS